MVRELTWGGSIQCFCRDFVQTQGIICSAPGICSHRKDKGWERLELEKVSVLEILHEEGAFSISAEFLYRPKGSFVICTWHFAQPSERQTWPAARWSRAPCHAAASPGWHVLRARDPETPGGGGEENTTYSCRWVTQHNALRPRRWNGYNGCSETVPSDRNMFERYHNSQENDWVWYEMINLSPWCHFIKI